MPLVQNTVGQMPASEMLIDQMHAGQIPLGANTCWPNASWPNSCCPTACLLIAFWLNFFQSSVYRRKGFFEKDVEVFCNQNAITESVPHCSILKFVQKLSLLYS